MSTASDTKRSWPSSRPRRSLFGAVLSPALLALSLALLASGCRGVRTASDPTLEVRSVGGQELAVSTDHGVVFLGRTARSGRVEITAWFGDGPSIEASVIEPLGGGLYTAVTEIRLPTVPLSFVTPRPGQEVLVRGRRGRRVWQERLKVRSHPRVDGILLTVPSQLRNETQVGAGVFYADDGKDLRLVGLVSGRVELFDADGTRSEYLTVVGPEDLWRLVTYQREYLHKRRWVYRDDIL